MAEEEEDYTSLPYSDRFAHKVTTACFESITPKANLCLELESSERGI